jgi:hypothetical protein
MRGVRLRVCQDEALGTYYHWMKRAFDYATREVGRISGCGVVNASDAREVTSQRQSTVLLFLYNLQGLRVAIHRGWNGL